LFNTNRSKAVVDIMPMIGARFYTQLDAAMLRSDVIEAELAKEVENGRLFRMLSKICTIIDRAEFVSSSGFRCFTSVVRVFFFPRVAFNRRDFSWNHSGSTLTLPGAKRATGTC
jgi:PAB-dependent poly(A)-specific ribonuclease subunit 3